MEKGLKSVTECARNKKRIVQLSTTKNVLILQELHAKVLVGGPPQPFRIEVSSFATTFCCLQVAEGPLTPPRLTDYSFLLKFRRLFSQAPNLARLYRRKQFSPLKSQK